MRLSTKPLVYMELIQRNAESEGSENKSSGNGSNPEVSRAVLESSGLTEPVAMQYQAGRRILDIHLLVEASYLFTL